MARAVSEAELWFLQAPVAMSVVSGPDLVYELANPRYLEMTGRSADIVGKPFREAFPEVPDDAPVVAMLREVYQAGKTFTADQYRVRLFRDGRFQDVYFQLTCQPVRGQAGTKIMTVAVEVSAHVEAQQRIEALLGELRKADRRKDEFLATLAHELRNPMAAVQAALSLLDRAGDDREKSARYRDTARRQMGNLVRLVDDLLDVARITRGKVELHKEDVDLATIVQNALAAVRPAWEARGHELSVTIAPGTFRLQADPTRLEQVVVNLVGNAARFTDPGGRIAVRLGLDESGGAPVGVLTVRDNGRGIPADMIEHIFDLFTQVAPTIDRQGGGLGLGLTLVRRLVEMHGGSVSAASNGPGHGSELTVRLPVARRLAPPAMISTPPVQGERRRVLLVEDADDVREMLSELIAGLGHEVFVAADGLEGIQRMAEVRPDIALVDVGLPHLDGFEVAERTRALPGGERIHLVALTGYGGPEVKTRAAKAGFDVHVTKPVDVPWLVQTLSRLRSRSS